MRQERSGIWTCLSATDEGESELLVEAEGGVVRYGLVWSALVVFAASGARGVGEVEPGTGCGCRRAGWMERRVGGVVFWSESGGMRGRYGQGESSQVR